MLNHRLHRPFVGTGELPKNNRKTTMPSPLRSSSSTLNSSPKNSSEPHREDAKVSLQAILSAACEQLFTSYGIDVAANLTSAASSDNVVGRIHFAGQRMTGNLTIGLDRSQLRSSLPFRTNTESELEDWARELANQLMGLVKTELSQYGVHVLLSLPLTVRQDKDPSQPKWPPTISQFNVSCNFANTLSCLDGVMTAEVQLQTP